MTINTELIYIIIFFSILVPLATLSLILFMHKKFLFCSNCKTGIVWPSKRIYEINQTCRKCKARMEWIEIPETFMKLRAKYLLIIMSLMYGACLYVLLYFYFEMFYGRIWTVIGLILVFVFFGGVSVVLYILDKKSKEEVLTWAKKLDNDLL